MTDRVYAFRGPTYEPERHVGRNTRLPLLPSHSTRGRGCLRPVIKSTDYGDAFPLDMDASLVNGNELHGKWRDVWIKVRLRPDGNDGAAPVN